MAIIKPNNNTISAITALPSAIDVGAMVKISTQNFSSVTSVAFTSIPDTYSTILFLLSDIQVGTKLKR